MASKLGLHHSALDLHVLGEHGDSQFAAFSIASIVGGVPLLSYKGAQGGLDEEAKAAARKAYEIIDRKKYTAYGVACSCAEIVQCILSDSKRVLPVSVRCGSS